MSEKNAAFHRLAAKRSETLIDQIRIFSNLSGPSYEWSSEEVLAYFGQIETALGEALNRFKEQKHWRAEIPAPLAVAEEVDDEIDVSDEPKPEAPAPSKETRRRSAIAQLIQDAADNEQETLAEMIVLQREVIRDLQRTIDELRGDRPT